LPATLRARDRDGVELDLDGGASCRIAIDKDLPPGSPVWLSVRPENLMLVEPAAALVSARVRQVLPLGSLDVIEAELGAGTLMRFTQPHQRGGIAAASDDVIHLAIRDPEACSIYSAGNRTVEPTP